MIEHLSNICWAESLKLRRSRAPLMSGLAMAMVPVAAILLMLSGNDMALPPPGHQVTLQDQLWLLHADWSRYFDVLAVSVAIGGLIIFGLLMIWIFGREHSDHTSKELLTLPIPRELLVAGKIMVAGLWSLLLVVAMYGLALILGAAMGLPAWSPEAFQRGLLKIFGTAILTFCLVIPFGLVANLYRGTMAAVGVLFMSLFFAMIIGALGWGACFPWSIPTLLAASTVPHTLFSHGPSIAVVVLTGISAAVGSMAWWRWADQR